MGKLVEQASCLRSCSRSPWADAEYLKLVRSLADGEIFDTPPQALERYVARRTRSRLLPWRFNHKIHELPRGRLLRIETLAPAVVHWSVDGWRTVRDSATVDSGLGVDHADLETMDLCAGASVLLTFYWPRASRWEGSDYSVSVVPNEEEERGGEPRSTEGDDVLAPARVSP